MLERANPTEGMSQSAPEPASSPSASAAFAQPGPASIDPIASLVQQAGSGISADAVLSLQRSCGNAAVGRLIAQRTARSNRVRSRLLQRTEYGEGEFGNRPNLVAGDTGAGVKLLQSLLGVKESGVFDQATRAAVDQFQRQQGWEPSGVGPMTWEKLETHAGNIGARPNLNVGDRGPAVKLLQTLLGVPETSVFDQTTRKAVDAFQRAQGWEPSGVGPMTWAALDARALPTTQAEAKRIAELRRKLDEAISYDHWREAALYLNGFSPQDIQSILAGLNNVQKSAIYQGATLPGGPGPDSNVAQTTKTFYLDGEISKAIVSSQWGWAAKYLNAFNEPDLRQRLNGFKTPDIQQIHDAAQTTPGVGPDSAVSKVSATVLEQRKNAPTPADEKLAAQLYDALNDGINRGDAKALEAAKQLAVMFYEVRTGARGEVSVTVNVTNLRNVAKRAGISAEGLEKCVALVRPFAPKDKPLYIDYAGRIGTKEDLAAREQADKLRAITSADTTLGSLLMSYVAARGGNAAEMRAANEFGSNLQAFASTMPVAGANSPAHSSVEEQNRTGAEVRPKDPAVKDDAPPPEPPLPSGGGTGGPPSSVPPGPVSEAPAAGQPKERPREPVPRPLEGGGGGNKRASAQAAADKDEEPRGFPGGPLGERKPEAESAENRAPQANVGENRSAAALNKAMGPTVQSPEHVKEYAAQLESAKARDGLPGRQEPGSAGPRPRWVAGVGRPHDGRRDRVGRLRR